MKVSYQNSILYKVDQRVQSLKLKIILRKDLEDLGDYRQISRALNSLVKAKKLARIGKGVYAKMRSSVINQKPVLDGAFPLLAREALNRLEVEWEPERAEIEYNQNRSTQVPVNARVYVKDRFSRKISFGNMEFRYEHFAKYS